MTTRTDRLLGTWRVARSDDPAFAGSRSVFRPGGELLHLTPAPPDATGTARFYGMQLAYRVDGDVLVTDQPSAPGEDRVRFRLEPAPEGIDGGETLWLDTGGDGTWYVRDEAGTA